MDIIINSIEVDTEIQTATIDVTVDLYRGEKGKDGKDGKDAVLPENIVIDADYNHTDENYTSEEKALVATIPDKVDKLTGYSLVADAEILKIHARNTDSTLLSENGMHSVYVDNSGVFHVKDISQVGTLYVTHAEQIYTTKNEIILRDGAIAGLGVGEVTGLRAKLYDGVNDGHLVFDRDGWARVGDVGSLQKLATIEETTTDGWLMKYNASTLRLEGFNPLSLPISTATQTALNAKQAALGYTPVNKAGDTMTGALIGTTIQASAFQDLNGNTPFKAIKGGVEYHETKWFTTTQSVTISADGLSVTAAGAQFTAGSSQVSAMIEINGVRRIITTPNPTTTVVYVTEAFPAAMRGQTYTSAQWGLYCYSERYINVAGTPYLVIYDSIGRLGTRIDDLAIGNFFANITTDGFIAKSNYIIAFTNGTGVFNTRDTGLSRNSAGVLEVNNGTAGTLRDLKLRNLISEAGQMTYGANDSAGTGYRTVRVPNA